MVQGTAEGGPAHRIQTRGQKLLAALLDLCEVIIGLDAAARDAHNLCMRGEWPREVAAEQRRQQLAHRQIAGAAEKHQIEVRQLLRRRRTVLGRSQAHSLYMVTSSLGCTMFWGEHMRVPHQ